MSILTIGQYLQPTKKHHAVIDFVTPDEFKAYETVAYSRASCSCRPRHDALVASRGRGFRQAQGGAIRKAWTLTPCRHSVRIGMCAIRLRKCSISWRLRNTRNSCRCVGLKVRRRIPGGEGVETLIADMEVGYKAIREKFTSRVTMDRPNLKDSRRICRRYIRPSRKSLEVRG